jgi:non-specific protein-tyrosine kinase
MELAQYLRLFRKWAWLFAVAAFVGGGISYVNASQRPAVYEASTTVSIGRFLQEANPTSQDIWTGIDLATTYAQLIRTFSILEATVNELNLSISPDELEGLISTRVLDGTSLLVISVRHTDPTLTADIANTLAEQLVLQSPTNLTSAQQAQIVFAEQQIEDLNAQLQDSRNRIALIDQQLAAGVTEAQAAALTTQRDSLISQINDAAATVADFAYTITTLQSRTNAVDIVEEARIPTGSTGTSPLNAALLGAMLGVALVGGVVLLIEYLDDKIRTSEQAAQVLKLPILGVVSKFGGKNTPYPDMLIAAKGGTPEAEGFRGLRTNLLFSALESDTGKTVLMVTSAGPAEGKSVTAANLAVVIAQAGLQVLLIDSDLRRPRIHEIFSLPNEFGLTNLLFADPNSVDLGDSKDVDDSTIVNGLMLSVQPTGIPRLRVITSGFIPANPAEILGSGLMKRWVNAFLETSNVDVVLFDSPPALIAADASVLARNVDANVVLVLDAGMTRRAAAIRMKEQFEQLNVRIKGVVLNRVNPREEHYGYGYGYGYGYYYAPQSTSNGKPAQDIRIAPRK